MPNKKKILFIHHGSAEGGAFQSLFHLIKALDHSKYDPIVCSGDQNDPQVEALFSAEGYAICSCNLPRFAHTTLGGYSLYRKSGLQGIHRWFNQYPSSCLELEQLLNTVKPALVHFNSLTLAPYTCVAKKCRIPAIVHIREPVLHGIFGFRRAWLRKHLIDNTSKVIAICKDNLDRLTLPEGKGKVIYNPVSFKKFDFRISKDDARLQLGIPIDAKVVLMTVTSSPMVKGFVPFIKAMQQVVKTNRNLYCLMPGLTLPVVQHPEIKSVRRIIAFALGRYRVQARLYGLANNGGLSGRIICCNFARDMEQWIAAADIVCVPHTLPHFSRTLLEAGAMKKPVIASRLGGLEECIREGETGLLVPAGNVRALAQAVERLLQDELEMNRMGENNYQFAISEADAALSAQSVMEVYHELLV
jgi:glycosyltransferase involved in cell wall biosynthesis